MSCNLRHLSKNATKDCTQIYLQKVEQEIVCTGGRAFFKYVNSKRRDNGYSQTVIYDNYIRNTLEEIANFFAEQFQSVYISYTSFCRCPNSSIRFIDTSDVSTIILSNHESCRNLFTLNIN